MNYKNLVLFFMLLASFFELSPATTEDIQKKHQKVITEYALLSGNLKLYNSIELQHLFKIANQVDSDYIKALRKDITALKKILKKKKKSKTSYDVEHDLVLRLEKIHKFIKKYYLELDVVTFLEQTYQDWGDIIKAVDKGQDILPLLGAKGISKSGIGGLRIFINKMNRLLDKVENYENRLHADFIDLKLSNYVLKIELIRIRNSAIFHPLYRGTPIVTNYPR